jgi:hypothetical protein
MGHNCSSGLDHVENSLIRLRPSLLANGANEK